MWTIISSMIREIPPQIFLAEIPIGADPVWMPINYLIIQSIRKYGNFYGNALKVECPVGSGNFYEPGGSGRFSHTTGNQFIPARISSGSIPQYGKYNWFYQQPGNEHLNLFYEYFHGDNGTGPGSLPPDRLDSLVAELIAAHQKSITKRQTEPMLTKSPWLLSFL